jgi:hypothetical protein
LLFLAFKGDSDMCIFTLCFRLKECKRATTIAVAIGGRAITVWEAIQKEAMNQSTKIEAKGLRATTFAIAKLEEQ